MTFERINDAIFRLKIPFEKTYTSVFLLCTKGGAVLVDGGASSYDAERYVIPALRNIDVHPSAVIRSHSHHDHSGGVMRIAEEYSIKIGICEDDYPTNGWYFSLCDGDVIFDRFEILNLKGHSEECIAIYDRITKTLLSFDCLQGAGLVGYGINVKSKKEYLDSIQRLRTMDIDCVVSSHSFLPLGDVVPDKRAVYHLFDICEESI